METFNLEKMISIVNTHLNGLYHDPFYRYHTFTAILQIPIGGIITPRRAVSFVITEGEYKWPIQNPDICKYDSSMYYFYKDERLKQSEKYFRTEEEFIALLPKMLRRTIDSSNNRVHKDSVERRLSDIETKIERIFFLIYHPAVDQPTKVPRKALIPMPHTKNSGDGVTQQG